MSATETKSTSLQIDSKSAVATSQASASSTGRSKIALKPGRSLMDWIRLTHSGKDLALTGGKCLEVSSHDLSRHNTMKDAWISLEGNVYNITYYLEYHPGGEEELMRGAGKDATDLFNQVHQWVNAESMLRKCFVGVLKKSWSLNVSNLSIGYRKLKYKKPAIATDSISTPSTLSRNVVKDVQTCCTSKTHWPVIPVDHEELDKIILKIQEDENHIKLTIEILSMVYPALITDLVNRMLFIKFNKYMDSQIYSVEFPTCVKQHYNVNIPFGEKFFEILLTKMTISICKSAITWTLCEQTDNYFYWPCKLISKTVVNYNTYLFTFLLPEGTRMWIPIGGHVNVKCNIKGEEVIRKYTPVLPFCDDIYPRTIYKDGHYIALMIKIYQDGALTSVINHCNIGDVIKISNYCYNFSEALLLNCDSVVMFAAGTGLTPMINIIHWVIKAKDKQRSLLLLFFNKREEDILWRKELDQCCRIYNKFQVIHILSEATEKWCSFSGTINTELVNKLSTVIYLENNPYIFVCGPQSFTETTLRCLQTTECNMDRVHAFTG